MYCNVNVMVETSLITFKQSCFSSNFFNKPSNHSNTVVKFKFNQTNKLTNF